MLCGELKELCMAVWEVRGQRKRERCSEPLLVLGWESCVTGKEKKRREVTNSLCVCLS
jgi:hypothetical protein